MHLSSTAVGSTRSDIVAARQEPRPARQIQNRRHDSARGSPGSGPGASRDRLGPWRDGGAGSLSSGNPRDDPHRVPRLDGQLEPLRNDPIGGSAGPAPGTGDQLEARLDGRAGRLRGGNRRGHPQLVPWLDGQLEPLRNDPIGGSTGPGPGTGLDRLEARLDGRAGRLRGGNRRGHPQLVPWLDGQLEPLRNDPIGGSTGPGPGTGLDRLEARLDGRAGRLRGGSRGGDPHLVPWLDGQLELLRNDPIGGSAGPGPGTGLDRLEARLDGHAGRLRGGNRGGDPQLVPWLDGQLEPLRNDPIGGSAGQRPGIGFDRLEARLDGHAGRLRGGNRGGDPHRVPLFDGHLELLRNEPIGGSAGQRPGTGLDRLEARLDGHAGRLRGGNRGGDPNPVPLLDGQLELLRNDPIGGSAGLGPGTGLDRLEARLDGRAGRLRRGNRGGDPYLVPWLDGQREPPSNDPIGGSAGSGSATRLDWFGARREGRAGRVRGGDRGGDPYLALRLGGQIKPPSNDPIGGSPDSRPAMMARVGIAQLATGHRVARRAKGHVRHRRPCHRTRAARRWRPRTGQTK